MPPGTDCGFCPWNKTKTTNNPECTVAYSDEIRTAECPARVLPGKPCVGPYVKTYNLPILPTATRWKWDWHNRNHAGNLLDLECKGGCIKVVMVSKQYKDLNANAKR